MIDKNFYNAASAKKLGWSPVWFGLEENDFTDKLVQKIKEFQSKYEDLVVDGMCGEVTFRRLYTEKQAVFENYSTKEAALKPELEKHIVCGGNKVLIEWENVVQLMDSGNPFVFPSNTYDAYKSRNVNQFVVHWDACLSSKSAFDVLTRRELSVQFLIDNDGTIYQCSDTSNVCWHAKGVNFESVGVEISNAVYTKYQKHYEKKYKEGRPVLPKQKIHDGTFGPLLGFYPKQIEALKALIDAVCGYYNIPKVVPLDEDGNLINTVHKQTDIGLRNWKGVLCHYHINKKKVDAIGLDLKKVVMGE